MKYKIPFIKPSFPDDNLITADYRKIIATNWFTNFGPFEQELSKKVADFLGGEVHVTTISNATLGLEAAIENIFAGSGKKVIIPSFTFAAGPEALIRAGYVPTFIDIDSKSWQPDVDQAKSILEGDPQGFAGILLCNIFGVGNAQTSKWEELAHSYKLPLVIDSAAGFGSVYPDGHMVGTRGDCEIFSMHATKPFAVGEGGLVVSRNRELIDNIRSWQNFGFAEDRNIHRIGTNAKLQEINAAIGIRQLEHYSERLKIRRVNLDEYKTELGVDYQFQENDSLSTVPFVSVLLPSSDMADLSYKKLQELGVEVRRYYTPLHLQAGLSEYIDRSADMTVTEDVASRILSLPLHDNMERATITFIANTIKDVARETKSV